MQKSSEGRVHEETCQCVATAAHVQQVDPTRFALRSIGPGGRARAHHRDYPREQRVGRTRAVKLLDFK